MSMDQGRPRSNHSRGFSFHSQNSGSGSKKDWAESPEEKKKKDALWQERSKANPNAALSEAQPGVANLTEESTLQNIRTLQHTDTSGNLIAEPDLSNPTRPRFERPLDTIRSFEKAIDNGYKRRSSYQRDNSQRDAAMAHDPNNQFASRRSSYFGAPGAQPGMTPFGPSGGGYYGNQRESYNGNGNQRPRGYSARMSEPAMNGGRPYGQPQHSYHQSYDTVNTGYTNGSDSTGQWASGTDPSSENSSIDRNMAMNGKAPGDGYGYNGPIAEEGGSDQGYAGYPQDGYGGSTQQGQQARYPNGAVQPPPAARRPIPLGKSTNGEEYQGGSLPSNTRGGGGKEEKRKSWLKRRFSKG